MGSDNALTEQVYRSDWLDMVGKAANLRMT